MSKPGRIRCEAVGCRRTAPADKYPAGTIIICGKCWRQASPDLRARWRLAQRKTARIEAKAIGRSRQGWPVFATVTEGVWFEECHSDERACWDAVMAAVNEARAGL